MTSPSTGTSAPSGGDPNFTSSQSEPGGVIVKYTYFGDANLDGSVDSSETAVIPSSSALALNGSSTVANWLPPGITMTGGTISNASIAGSGVLNLGGVLTVNAGSITTGSLDAGIVTGSSGSLQFVTNPLPSGDLSSLGNVSQSASGSLTINGSNFINFPYSGSTSPIGSSGTFILANFNGGIASQTVNVADSIPNTTYSFSYINGSLKVITSPAPAPTDPATVQTSITNDPNATTQITIP